MTKADVLHKAISNAKTLEEAQAAYNIVLDLRQAGKLETPKSADNLDWAYRSVTM